MLLACRNFWLEKLALSFFGLHYLCFLFYLDLGENYKLIEVLSIVNPGDVEIEFFEAAIQKRFSSTSKFTIALRASLNDCCNDNI
jgi:hypothetical protein